MELKTILEIVTVDSKDDGKNFTVTDRIQAIEGLLADTDYQLLHKGNLSRIFARKNVSNQSVILISSHVDCVYDRLFYQETDGGRMLKGTFDNSLTNACVLYDMIQGKLNDNVVVAFTGDEEKESLGAHEVMRTLHKWKAHVALAVVLDVKGENQEKKQLFSVANDRRIDIMTGHRIVEELERYHDLYDFIHDSITDESYVYDEGDIPCLSLHIPTFGNIHGEDGVLVRTSALPTFCSILSELANALS